MSTRKYDGAYRQVRQRLARAVAAGQATCWRCGRPIRPGEPWHLGHSDDGSRWMGAQHAYCNTSAAARMTNAKRNAPARWSRDWYGDRFDPRCPNCRSRGVVCDAAAG